MCEGGEGLTDHILPCKQLFSGAKVHQKAADRPGTRAQAVRGRAGPRVLAGAPSAFSGAPTPKYLK